MITLIFKTHYQFSIQSSNIKQWKTYILKSFKWSLFPTQILPSSKFRLPLKCSPCENLLFKAKISLYELSYSVSVWLSFIFHLVSHLWCYSNLMCSDKNALSKWDDVSPSETDPSREWNSNFHAQKKKFQVKINSSIDFVVFRLPDLHRY